MKKYLYTFGSFVIYIAYSFGLDAFIRFGPVIDEPPYELKTFEDHHFYTWISYILFAVGTLIYVWYIFNSKINYNSVDIVIVLIGILAALAVGVWNYEILTIFPFNLFWRIPLVGYNSRGLTFQAYLFSALLSFYNLIRFNWHKLPFVSKSSED